jgi:hypothetical protein
MLALLIKHLAEGGAYRPRPQVFFKQWLQTIEIGKGENRYVSG